jgi:hypothetical protein
MVSGRSSAVALETIDFNLYQPFGVDEPGDPDKGAGWTVSPNTSPWLSPPLATDPCR